MTKLQDQASIWISTRHKSDWLKRTMNSIGLPSFAYIRSFWWKSRWHLWTIGNFKWSNEHSTRVYVLFYSVAIEPPFEYCICKHTIIAWYNRLLGDARKTIWHVANYLISIDSHCLHGFYRLTFFSVCTLILTATRVAWQIETIWSWHIELTEYCDGEKYRAILSL